jgi:hypothetical protein
MTCAADTERGLEASSRFCMHLVKGGILPEPLNQRAFIAPRFFAFWRPKNGCFGAKRGRK